MDKDNRFPFSLDYEGKQLKGTVTPSEEKNAEGRPVYFRVELNGQFFAYLCCAENGWYDREQGDRPKDLIGAIGELITQYYE